MAHEKAKLYFAVFKSLTQESLESCIKFFEESESLLDYKDVFHHQNFYKLKNILNKESFSEEDFLDLEYDRPDDEDDDVCWMFFHLRYELDIISLGRIQETLAKDFDDESSFPRLIDEAIELYGLTEEERSIFYIADHCDDEARMLEFIRNFKQTSWERDVLFEILSSILVDDGNIFEAMNVAIVDEKYKDLRGIIDNYSYPEAVQKLIIKNVTLRKNFFKNLEKLVEESKKIVEDPNKDVK